MWIFSMLTLIPVGIITLFTGQVDVQNIFIQITGWVWLGIFVPLSHTSARNQILKNVDIIKGIKMGFQDCIMYIKLFLNIG